MRLIMIVASCALLFSSAASADGCDGFKWNLSREYALYAGSPTRLAAAGNTKEATPLKTDTLYELALTPQDQVSYALPPGKKMLSDEAYGGVVRFQVPSDGDYRIGLDVNFWIDVIADGKQVASKDFGGPQGCAKPPHKLVEFSLKAGTSYLLQFSGQTPPSVHVTVVKSEPATR